jgi:hypothetical protein
MMLAGYREGGAVRTTWLRHCHGGVYPDKITKRGGIMSKLLRGLAAGWGAKKLGGGCFSTIIVFLVLWWLLGNFDIFK